MKTLYRYLCEAVFQSVDYTKTKKGSAEFKYAKPVINDLLNSDQILLGVHGEEIRYLDKKDQENFKKEYDDSKFPMSSIEFNKLISKYPSFPKWNEIYKGVYSGKTTITEGELAEGLVCYLFNNHNANPNDYKEVMPNLKMDWINSSNWTVEFMNKQTGISNIPWTNKNYIACCVRGDDFKFDSTYNFALEVASIFSGKSAMKKIFNINCNDLYSKSKDIWNKADIILVHKQLGKSLIKNIINNGVYNGEMLNSYLIEYTKQGVIVPISLKQLTNKNAHLSSVNIYNNESINIIKEVKHIRLSSRYDSKYTGNIDIICKSYNNDDILITFRSDTNGKNGLSIEPKNDTNGYRFGKATEIIRNLLKLNKKDFYQIKNTNEESLNELKSFGFNIVIPHKSNYNITQPELRERACCAGLLGVLNEYKKVFNETIDKDFPLRFSNFCVLSAMGLKGKGAFYKISN